MTPQRPRGLTRRALLERSALALQLFAAAVNLRSDVQSLTNQPQNVEGVLPEGRPAMNACWPVADVR